MRRRGSRELSGRCAISLITDVLSTVFTTQGVQHTITAFQQVENAQRRLDEAQAKADPKKPASMEALDSAAIRQEQLFERLHARMASMAVQVFREIVSAAQEAIESYSAFATHAMNVRDLMGSTGDEAAKITTLFAAVGMNHLASIREINRMSRDTLTPQGQKALGQLGIDPHGTNSGLALFNEIRHGLEGMTNGIEKAALMQQIFGVRGVHNMLPLLRITDEYWHRLEDVTSVSEEGLETAQRWSMANALLGATWEQKIVFPIVNAVLPALIVLVDVVTRVIHLMGSINQATHGWLGFAAVIAVIGAGIGVMVAAWTAYSVAAKIAAGWSAVLAALTGNWQNLAAGVAVAAAVGIGLTMWDATHQQGTPGGGPQGAHATAMQAHTEALNRNSDNLNMLNGGGIPRGLQGEDIYQLARQNALGAIG